MTAAFRGAATGRVVAQLEDPRIRRAIQAEIHRVRGQLMPLVHDAVPRRARKAWACECPGNGHQNCPHAGCHQTILAGDDYVEYLGSAAAYSSGTRYCIVCGLAVWTIDPTGDTS